MKKAIVVFLATALIACMAGLSFAGVKITLKNGRTITAESCRDMKGKLLCDLEGGTFEIDRQEIVSMQDTKVLRQTPAEVSDEPKPAGSGKLPENEKPLPSDKPVVKGSEGKVVTGLTPDQISRLDQINEKKAALKPERERLDKEREQLNEDVKNLGLIRRQSQLDEIRGRMADLDARIKGFNDEAAKLNEEERAIIDLSSEAK
ncbi:MAG: hypothetical protein HZB31_03290 [Nitrospirae bacterium]|nr:hypothetical protein [Nitrospirota bacterium]